MPGVGLPLFGRTGLLERLVRGARSGASLLLRGPAGVGKTRLAAEVCHHDTLRARPVDRLLASPATAGQALGTLTPLAGTAIASAPLAEVYEWCFTRWRARAIDGAGALVWLDDAQHVDPLSAALLRQAVTAGVAQLLATYRTPGRLPDDIRALRTEGLLTPVDVPPLDPTATVGLARAAASAPLAPQICERIVQLSRGNPLYTRELADVVTAQDDAMAWRNLRSLVGHPVDELPADRRRTLELIAAAEPVPAALLAGRAHDVAELLRAGLVLRHDEDTLRVDHPLRAAWIAHQAGPLAPEIHRELVELAAQTQLTDAVDPFTVMEWHLRGGIDPDPERAVATARLAIARGDGPTAQRMAAAVTGPQRALLTAQAQLITGDIDRGMSALDEVRRTGELPQRVEAASWTARYLGVMHGDFAGAHEVLASVDDDALDPGLRRLVWMARAWLWLFGPIDQPGQVQQIAEVARAGPTDRTAYDVLSVSVALGHQTTDPVTLEPLIDELRQLERMVDPGGPARARARGAEGFYHLSRGEPDVGAALCSAELARALQRGDGESAALLGGVAGLLAAQHGRMVDAHRMTSASLAVPEQQDWFNYLHITRLVDIGIRSYLGRADEAARDLDRLTADPTPSASFDLHDILLARARRLVRGHRGTDVPADLTALEQLAVSNKQMWMAAFASELLDLRDPAPLLTTVRDAATVGGPGLIGLVAELFDARLRRDADAVCGAGMELELAGLPIAASRALADVLRIAPDGARGDQARHGLLRLDRAWDGAHMWWTADVPGMPTARQVQMAWAVVDGASIEQVAAELTLSRRTVENHLYRITRSLGVSGRDELVVALAPRQRPAGWLPGASRRAD